MSGFETIFSADCKYSAGTVLHEMCESPDLTYNRNGSVRDQDCGAAKIVLCQKALSDSSQLCYGSNCSPLS